MIKETLLFLPLMFLREKPRSLYSEKKKGRKLRSWSHTFWMFTQRTWAVLTKQINFTHIIMLEGSRESGTNICFGFLWIWLPVTLTFKSLKAVWNMHKIFSILSRESDSSAISTPGNNPQVTLCRLSLGHHWPIFPQRSRAVTGSVSTAKLKGRKLPKTIQSKQNLCQQCRVALCQDQCFRTYHNGIWFTSLTWIFNFFF